MMASPFQFSFNAPPSPWFTSPSDVKNYIRIVGGEISSLNADIMAAANAGKVTNDFVAQRAFFVTEWNAFADEYNSSGWFWTAPNTAWDQTAQYQAKNEAWRSQLQAAGVKPTEPGAQERPADPDVAGAVKWAAAAGIAAAVAYGVYKFAGRSN